MTDFPVEGKKRKLEEDSSVFKSFKLIKVLREDDRHKMINVLGSLDLDMKGQQDQDSFEDCHGSRENKPGDESLSPLNALVLLERKPFYAPTIEECLQQTKTKQTLHNDIYSTYDVYSPSARADIKATMIYPATEKHIAKYSEHEPSIIHETPELYKTVTLPCLEQSKFSIQWVYNILDKKKESERIVVEDPDPETGFLMVPDMKWDLQKIDSLYLVAIVHKKGLRSLRDLRIQHLPLLRNILEKGQAAIKEKYAVSEHQLRVYVHYQPSYYHLHVHFTHIKFDAPGSDVLRAHLLQDVIDNINLDSEFYSKKTLSYVLRTNEELHKRYTENGYFDCQ